MRSWGWGPHEEIRVLIRKDLRELSRSLFPLTRSGHSENIPGPESALLSNS